MRGRIDFGDIDPNGNLPIDANLQLTGGGSIITTSNGNLTLLPNGSGITIIGDAGSTSRGLNTNDSLFVSGPIEVDGTTYLDGGGTFAGQYIVSTNSEFFLQGSLVFQGTGSHTGSNLKTKTIIEQVTIPVGSGNTPVVTSSSNLAVANSIIRAVAVRVTQAPGGGASVVSVGRSSGGNTDEFIDDISTALGTTGNSVANNDGVLAAEDMWNASADTFEITTDADVTGTDMKLRIVVWYDEINAPTS